MARPAAPGDVARASEAMPPPAAQMGAAAAPAQMPPPGMPAPTSPSGRDSAPAKTGAAPSGGNAASTQAKSSPNAPKLEDEQKPLLIYEGALGLEVVKSDMPQTIERSIDVAESLGGYLVSRTDTSVELRVPSHEFRNALKKLGEIGSVTKRSVTAQDVSEEFHDLGIRLKNLEGVRNRLEQFLARAANVDEALRVGKELENVVRQIDEIKGRMQFLKTRAAFSRITIALTPKPEQAPVVAKTEKPEPPPAKPAKMPVDWLRSVGLDKLLELQN